MGVVKVQEKRRIWTTVFMMVIGKMIRSVEWGSFSTWIKLNTMGNGKTMFEKAMEHIITRMEIDMRESGKRISKMVRERITMQMEIFIRDSG